MEAHEGDSVRLGTAQFSEIAEVLGLTGRNVIEATATSVPAAKATAKALR